jgi:hypothetical protein
MRKAEAAAPYLAGAVIAAPVLLTRYPPMTDLPMHESILALMLHHGQPGWSPPGLYQLHLFAAHQLFYYVAAPLALIVGTTWACKLVVAAIMMATLVAGARLAEYLGGRRSSALALAPLTLGWLFYFGFVGNMLGLALFLWALPFIDRQARAPSARGTIISCALLVLLQLAHQTSLLSAMAAVTVCAGLQGPDAAPLKRRAWHASLVVGFGLLLSFIELRREVSVATPFTQLFSQQVRWNPLPGKLRTIPAKLIGKHGNAAPLLFWATSLVVAVSTYRRRRGPAPTEGAPGVKTAKGLRARLAAFRFLVLAGALFLVYLAAPYSINFGFYLYARFLAPAAALVVLAAPACANRAAAPDTVSPSRRWLYFVLLAALPVATVALSLPAFADAAAQHRALDTLYERIDRESAVAVLKYGREPLQPYDAANAGNRVLAVRGGRLLFSFAEYPISPVTYAPASRWESVLFRTVDHAPDYRPGLDGRSFHYVLAYIPDRDVAARVAAAFAPEARVAAAAGDWVLFASTLPRGPIDVPERVAPESQFPSIRDRDAARGRAP